ncbi:MAG: MFS transporter [Clostridiales Family XIII bacterium]|jgi:predicted MFS family arabinose efflux permease|nr:MFS transporter [Clostridiales Family XIII bacterium]
MRDDGSPISGAPAPKLWTKNFIILTLANMSFMFGFNMMPPTIPLFITGIGGTKTQVGLVAMSFSIAAILTRFFAPIILQKFGKRRMLRIGFAATLVVTFACGFAQSIPLILMFRVLQGVAFGFISTLTTTLAADLLPDARRGEGIGYFGMGITAVTAISPALGIFIVTSSTFFVMFLTASIGQLLSVFGLAFFRPPAEVLETRAGAPKLSLKSSFFEPALLLQCVLLVFMGTARSAEQNYISLLAEEYAIVGLSWYFIVQTGVSFVAKFFTGRLYDAKGPGWSIIPGGVSWIIAFALMSVSHNIGILLVAGVFSGFGMGMLLPAMQTWCISRVTAERRSVASALYFNFYDIGIGIGAIILGALFEGYGAASAFRVASASMVVFTAIYLISAAAGKRATS